jgi:CobQ/CobB/MinD/ParA family nucleotide binding protein
VPIQCEYYALEGLGQLLRNVRLVQQNVNTGLRLTGIVMTMFDPRTKLSEQVVAEVRRYFGDRVYQTIIPRTVRLSEAPGFGQPITVYDPHSKGAQSYRDLASEVATRLPDERPLPNVDDVPSVVIPPPEPQPVKAPRPLVGPEDEVPGRTEPAPPPEEDEGGAEPEAEPPGEPPIQARDAPEGDPALPGGEPEGKTEPTDASADPAAETGAGSHPPAESERTLDQGSTDAARGLADLNGDRTEAEPQEEPTEALTSDRDGSTDPGKGRRRRGLFRRGGT